MNKQMIFVVAGMIVVGMAAIQSMRTGVVATEPLAVSQTVAPFEMMLKARDLPVQTIKDPI